MTRYGPDSAVSYGAGVNSTAMIIRLVQEGWHGDILLADTGAEWPDTYCYMDYFEREWLQPRGLAITRLGAEWRASGWHEKPLIEYLEHYAITPRADARFCTQAWKTEPIGQWCAAHGDPLQLVGIAADEAHRQKGRACPLIDWGIGRAECVRIIQAEGLEAPRKSGCWICPFQKLSQWKELLERYPELYARGEALEAAVSLRRGVQGHIRVGSDVTLAQLRLRFESQMGMFDDELMDGLMLYRPCVCGL
jgi:3'-phosphoadenosine 5'-phosphosulfate sulfotransferase (PAPS reductase)/FAD synthetase